MTICKHIICKVCGGVKARRIAGELEDYCHPKCQSASGPVCECKCKGEFHKGENASKLNKLISGKKIGMTDAQKKSRARFKAAVSEAAKLRNKNPRLSQAEAVKQAWSILYGKERAGKKIAGQKKPAKKTAKKTAKKAGERHTDTKSHNVNIKVMSGVKHNRSITGYNEKNKIVKKYTISELKKMNPVYFAKGSDKSSGVYKRKLIVSPKFNTQVMIEAQKNPFTGVRSYTVRKISSGGEILSAERFSNIMEAAAHIGKNIIL